LKKNDIGKGWDAIVNNLKLEKDVGKYLFTSKLSVRTAQGPSNTFMDLVEKDHSVIFLVFAGAVGMGLASRR
jgi:hypothetical protein